MAPKAHKVVADDRLDRILAELPKVGSRRRAQRTIESGKVLVDGQRITRAGQIVRAGSEITIEWNRPGTGVERRKGQRALVESGLQILFEDPYMVAVDKPPGLLTDTASEEQHRTRDSVYKRLRTWLRPRGDRPRTVHRIDRDTSGVVLFARTDAAESSLRQQFMSHQPERIYRAIVAGHPELSADPSPWVDHTRWHRGRRILEALHPEAPGARETISYARLIRELGDRSEIEVQIQTGRRNQIRLQAALRGHALVGDRLYGPSTAGPRAARQLLHAWRLTVAHPATGDPVRIEAPFPADWPG